MSVVTTNGNPVTKPCAAKSRPSIVTWVMFALVAALIALLLQSRSSFNALKQATFKSPLPEVKVASEGKPLSNEAAYKHSYEFTQDWFTPNVPIWEKLVGSYKGKPNVQYLEIGLYEGRSALWMLDNVLTDPSCKLTGLDIFDGALKDRFFRNLKQSQAEARTNIIIETSQTALRRLPLESFDIIYIDGSHATADVLEDAILSFRLLKPGGILIFDDYQWAGAIYTGPDTNDAKDDLPKLAIDAFTQIFDKQLTVIHNSYQLALQKKK